MKREIIWFAPHFGASEQSKSDSSTDFYISDICGNFIGILQETLPRYAEGREG